MGRIHHESRLAADGPIPQSAPERVRTFAWPIIARATEIYSTEAGIGSRIDLVPHSRSALRHSSAQSSHNISKLRHRIPREAIKIHRNRMSTVFEPRSSQSRQTMAAPSVADSLPSINFGFDELRDRMAKFTAKFDAFIEHGRKRVLEEKNQFVMQVTELQG